LKKFGESKTSFLLENWKEEGKPRRFCIYKNKPTVERRPKVRAKIQKAGKG